MLVKYRTTAGFFRVNVANDYVSCCGELNEPAWQKDWSDGFVETFGSPENFLKGCDVLLPEEFVINDIE